MGSDPRGRTPCSEWALARLWARVTALPLSLPPPHDPDPASQGPPDHRAEGESTAEATGAGEGIDAWRQLRGDWDELRAAWGGTPSEPRSRRLAELEGQLFELEASGPLAAGGVDPPAHARAVAGAWRERLERSGRTESAGRLLGALRDSRLRWLKSRRPRPATGPDGAFVALLQIEESILQWVAGSGVLSEGGGAEEGMEEVRSVRDSLRAVLSAHAAAGGLSTELRSRMAGRMVDHADDAILLSGEATADACARGLEAALEALTWHLGAVETEAGRERDRLQRRRRRVERELVEQRLQAKLEARFGASRVALWERAVVACILGVLLLLGVEVLGIMGLITVPRLALTSVDTAICAFLLVDFGVKLGFVSRRRLWLRRHIWTDLIPAIPFGLFAGLDGFAGEAGQASRLIRLFRLARIGAYLRALRPLVWLVRALGFLLRGLDRVVRRHARALEMEVVVFPTPAEQRELWRRDVEHRRAVASLRRAVDGWYADVHEVAEEEERSALERTRGETLRAALERSAAEEPQDRGRRRAQLPLADDLLRQVAEISGEELVEELGASTVDRLARAARLVAGSPLRWLPGLGSWAAPDALGAAAAEHVARCLHRIADALHRALARAFWWADLHGTLTPGEVVGRIGAALVARTSRPAVRLLLFGIPFLGLQLAFAALDTRGDEELRSFAVIRLINGVVGQTFALLGGICLVLLAIGAWLQRMARDTTTFHEKVARAQFLHLTDSLKARTHRVDAAFLQGRVFLPERRILGDPPSLAEQDAERFHSGLHEFLRSGEPLRGERAGFDPVARTVLLYRDQLDGALLAHTDTRATSQLLGNLAVRRLAEGSGRVSARRLRWMQSLDLERRRTLVRGPFLWFHAISRSLESRAARLIVEYNANAIPLADWARSSEAERAEHAEWLRCGGGVREAEPQGEGADRPVRGVDRGSELTTAFTVLHFLDDHPSRDEEIAQRFGEEVVGKMRRDRRALIRSVFGTYPLHLLPLESRVLNLRRLYEEWLQGGRVLLLPIRMSLSGARLSVVGARRLVRAVGMIRRPGVSLEAGVDHEAGFDVAVRKIHRMRGPAAVAAMELRAILDPEYHGLSLLAAGAFEEHGAAEGGGVEASGASSAMADARYLGADPASVRLLGSLERRAARSLARTRAALEGGLGARLGSILGADPTLDREGHRALQLVIHGDVDGVRSVLFGEAILVESVVDALLHGVDRAPARPRLALRLAFHRWWRRGGKQRVLRAALSAGALDRRGMEGGAAGSWRRRQAVRRVRRSAWRILAADTDGARACLSSALLGEGAPERGAAEARLAEELRHPSRISEQLVTLRATQALTLLDVRNYREQVWRVGGYAEDGDHRPRSLPGAV